MQTRRWDGLVYFLYDDAFWPVHLQQEHKGDRGDQQAARPVARAQKVQALECA